jgi:hypothetical protein
MDIPKVFQTGVATTVLNKFGNRVYIGQHELKFIKSISIHADIPLDKYQVTIQFQSPETLDVQDEIEEQIRIVKTCAWISVVE